MKHKGVISEVVPWADSRTYFYSALKRRLAESAIEKELSAKNPSLSPDAIKSLIGDQLKAPLDDLANGQCTMADLRISKVVKMVHSDYVVEQVAKMPVES